MLDYQPKHIIYFITAYMHNMFSYVKIIWQSNLTGMDYTWWQREVVKSYYFELMDYRLIMAV